MSDQTKFDTLPKLKRKIKELNPFADIADEIVLCRDVDEEIERMRQMRYIVVGEIDTESPEDFGLYALQIFGCFGVAKLHTRTVPQRLQLTSGYKPNVARFLSLSALCATKGNVDCLEASEVARALDRPLSFTSELIEFAKLVQSFVEQQYVELRRMPPDSFALLAIERWQRLGVAEPRPGIYDLADQVITASAVLLSMSSVQCDPTTEKWSLRPGYNVDLDNKPDDLA